LRPVLFVLLVVGLTAALLWVDSGHHREPRSEPVDSTAPQVPRRRAPVPTADLTTARHFLSAFLSLEVGGGRRAARAAIRTDSVGSLAHQLLAGGPRSSAATPPARIGALHLDRLPCHPGLILVSGSARRPSGPEPFSFLFARRGGRWLAVAPAE
jgi:hypothetical protein